MNGKKSGSWAKDWVANAWGFLSAGQIGRSGLFSFFLLPITCDRNILYRYGTNPGTSGNTGCWWQQQASERTVSTGMTGNVPWYFNPQSSLKHPKWGKSYSNSVPSRQSMPPATIEGPWRNRPSSQALFHLFGHFRKNCRYVGLSTQGRACRPLCPGSLQPAEASPPLQ